MTQKKMIVCGVPLTAEQVDAIETAKAKRERSIRVKSVTAAQAAAMKKAADEADRELREIAEAMKDRPVFAIKMQRQRKLRGMTLDQLAEITGITKSALSKIERGHNRNPTIDTLGRIGKGLGLSLTVDYKVV